MADPPITPTHRTQPATTRSTFAHDGGAFMRWLHNQAPNQLTGFLTLIVSGGILLLLTGLTITAVVVGLISFTPLLLISTPIWIPIAALTLFTVAGTLSMCGFCVAVLVSLSWMSRYFRGLHPAGSDRVEYARSRIYDTASHMKEYGGYLQSKVKDAAPGA